MTKGFFNKEEVEVDLTLIPGDKSLLKPKPPKKAYSCDDCRRCSKGNIKVRDEELSTEDKEVFKMVSCGAPDPIEPEGLGEKKIMIVVDELTEYAQVSGSPIVGNERKLLEKALNAVGLDLYRDCWVVNAIRGKARRGGNVGFARKACSQVLKADIERLQPKVIVTSGFSALSVLKGSSIKVAKEWEKWVATDKDIAIPDQSINNGTWLVPMFGTKDFIWMLNNKLTKVKQWAKESLKTKGYIPKYQQEILDGKKDLIDYDGLKSDEFNLKWRWFIRDWKTVINHLDKEVPIDDADEIAEILTDKKDIKEAIEYFKTQTKVSMDIEATSLSGYRKGAEILCIGFSNLKRSCSWMTRDPEVIEWTKELLLTPTVELLIHNCPYEFKMFKGLWGITLKNVYCDTQILAHAFDARTGTSSLKDNTYRFVGVKEYEKQAAKFFKCIEADKGTRYEKSAQALNQLGEALDRQKLIDKGLLYPLPVSKELDKDTKKLYVAENKRRHKELQKGGLKEEELLLYVNKDVIYTCKIFNALRPRLLNKREWEAVQFYTKSSITLAKVSCNGVKVDRAKLLRNISVLKAEAKELHIKIIQSDEAKQWDGEGELNYGSPVQLAHLLFDILKYKSTKETDSGGRSTSEATLEMLNSPMCEMILERKKLLKACNTYLEAIYRELDDNDIAHVNYSLALVSSFRSSALNFSFQNQIKHNKKMATMIRDVIIPHDNGIWAEGDYSSAEAVTASLPALSGDKVYYEFQTNPEADIHKYVAFKLFNLESTELHPITVKGITYTPSKGLYKQLRQISKSYTFSSSYGGGYYNIAITIWEKLSTLTKSDLDWLEQVLLSVNVTGLDAFIARVKFVDESVWGPGMFSAYAQWKRDIWEQYKKQGYIQNVCGFVYRDILSSMAVCNYPVQSVSFMKLMHAINLLQDALESKGYHTKIVGEVHDSICLSIVPEEMSQIKKLLVETMIWGTNDTPMFGWVTLDYRVDVDIYEGSWASEYKSVRLHPEDYSENYITA